jgi:hypothetical protein
MANGKTWEQRFPNPHTRPDPMDPLVAKTRADSKAIFGRDPLEEEVDFPAYLAELQAKHCSPEYQAAAAEGRAEMEALRARQIKDEHRRRMERLSPFHVDCIRSGCDKNLNPLTTTQLMRMVLGVEVLDDGTRPPPWDGIESLFLLGSTGTGKTYTATWIAMRAIMKGRDVGATNATDVCTLSPEKLARLHARDLVIIDQLHTLRTPAGKDLPGWQVEPVIKLINHCYEHKITAIGAGTIAPESMVDLLGKDVKRRFPVRLSSDETRIETTRNGGTG